MVLAAAMEMGDDGAEGNGQDAPAASRTVQDARDCTAAALLLRGLP